MPLTVSRHPLVADSLAGLRDRMTDPEQFRVLARNVITLLLYEATLDLPVKPGKVTTPLREADALMIEREVVAIPVLRAGLGLLAPVLELLPRVSVGYIGLERDENTAVARIYYNKLPKLEGKVPLLLDPMLATGGSAAQALDLIKEAGGQEPRFGRGAPPRGAHLHRCARRGAERPRLHRSGTGRLRGPPLRDELAEPRRVGGLVARSELVLGHPNLVHQLELIGQGGGRHRA